MKFVSYAQNLEDVMLWRALKHIENGFYVDVGACDHVEDSVTKAFYERGWHGINVEPLTNHYKTLCEFRPRDINLNVAVSDKPGFADFYDIDGGGLSTMRLDMAVLHHEHGGWDYKKIIVNVVTLAEITDKYVNGDVHFLKIDVEGSEKQTLEGMDFTAFRPWIIVIEASIANEKNILEPAFAEWEYLLLDNKYKFVYQDGANRFYISSEHLELERFFTYPPLCSADRFIQYMARDHSMIELQKEKADLEKALKEKSDMIATLMNSRSFRYTKPLRAILSFGRILLSKLPGNVMQVG